MRKVISRKKEKIVINKKKVLRKKNKKLKINMIDVRLVVEYNHICEQK